MFHIAAVKELDAQVATILEGLKLSDDYREVFAQQGIDYDTFLLLTKEDLVEMSVVIGDRKKILNEIAQLNQEFLPPSAL